jgi:hypothetical protein
MRTAPTWMEDFYNDYDYDRALITNALNILIDEWKIMQGQLIGSLRDQDKDAFDQVFHKIITTIKRFRLYPLMELLENIRDHFLESPVNARERMIGLAALMEKTRLGFEYQLHHLPATITTH